MKRRLKRIIKTARFYLLALLRKVAIGERKYSIRGVCQSKLAIATIEKNHEEETNPVLKAIFDIRKGAFIDVGANVGQTLIKLLTIDNNRQYIGFEPQVSGCFFIDQFLRDNKLNNHVIMPLGLSNRNEIVKLGLREVNDVTASMVEEYRPEGFYSYYQYIPVIPGDDILPIFELSSISVIKIDVEGGELEVIKGLRLTIEKYMPYIFFEVLPHYLFVTQTELDKKTREFRNQRHSDMERVLRGHGYVIYQIRPNDELRRIDAIKAARRHFFNYVANYVAVPQKEEVRLGGKLQLTNNKYK